MRDVVVADDRSGQVLRICITWGLLFAIPALIVLARKPSFSDLRKRFVKVLPLLASLLVLAGFIGFCVGGEVGLIGNSILAFLCFMWCFLISTPKGKSSN